MRIIIDASVASPWTVPSNWNSGDNKIGTLGAGAGSIDARGGYGPGGGVGGGAYSEEQNVALTPGSTVDFSVGQGGQPISVAVSAGSTDGGDTWFGGTDYASSFVAAKGGGGISDWASGAWRTSGAGGDAASGIGSIKNSGGAGGPSSQGSRGGAGGGAAGPHGVGGDGTALIGGAGDAGFGGAGGLWKNNGSDAVAPEFSGGGSGGVLALHDATLPGKYGAGAGGPAANHAGAAGYDGLIVIDYTPL